MKFTWDPRKDAENRRRHGLSFAGAVLIFSGFTVERDDLRREYGERRVVAIGIAEGTEITVCYTARQEFPAEVERRIISARRSNRRERKAYREASQRIP